MENPLKPHISPDACVESPDADQFRLIIPAGPMGQYRIAQVDDYTGRARSSFLHEPPFNMRLEARTSSASIPGTWGFGLWNAPLSLAFGFGGTSHLPALPNAAWFFHSSKENHLSFADNTPAHGFLSQTFRSPRIPIWLFAPSVILLPFLAVRPAARLLRRILSRWIIKDDGHEISDINTAEWHSYEMNWLPDKVEFCVDETKIHSTKLVPSGPLGIVIWIDNQFAAFTPEGRLGYGVLENPETAWLEIRNISIT